MDIDIEYDYIHIPKHLDNTFDKVYKRKKEEIKIIIIKNNGESIDFRSRGGMSSK